MKLFIDFETRSACDLKKHGAHVYSEHPTTDALCLAMKWEGKEPFILKDPSKLPELLEIADEIWAHNSSFEAAIWKNVCEKKYGWPPLPTEKLRCSAAKACMHSLPRHLEGACLALGLPVQKDMDGYKIMMRMCKPRRPRKGEPELNPDNPHGLYWHEDPADFERLCQYCMHDVLAEETLSKALRDLPEKELRVWKLDQVINERGILADLEACQAMIEMVNEHEAGLLKSLKKLTNGGVKTAKQVEVLRNYLRGLGVDLPDLAAATVKKALSEEELNETARKLLEIRRSLGRSSSAKYQAIIDRASSDHRVRGSLLYHQAGTGRWAGSGIQPQNFPSRIKVSADPEQMLNAVLAGGLDLHNAIYDDDPMSTAGAVTRSCLVAAPGMDLVVADYSAIEGRGLAWLAGEETELEIYRQDKDPYIASASMILHKPYDQITKDERQSPGKISVLACIAEGSLVLTDKGLVPIEKVSLSMKLWDGEEFVNHGGAIFKGVKELIDYDGLQATPDHVVFTEEGYEVELREAARSQQRLMQTGSGGASIRYGESDLPRYSNGEETSAANSLSVPELSDDKVDRHGKPSQRENGWLPEVQSAYHYSEVATEEDDRSAATMPESQRPPIQTLRGERHRIQIQNDNRGGALDDPEPGTGERQGNRSDRQQRPLRAGESPLGHTKPECKQHPDFEGDIGGLSSIPGAIPRDPLRRQYPSEFNPPGDDIRADNQKVLLPELQTKGPVWDILSAGPRNRFTVSGRLVHNCGYGGSVGAVRKFGGEGMTDEEIKEQIVQPWRDAHLMTTRFWRELEDACFNAVASTGSIRSARSISFKVMNKFLMCRLPSGRILFYYDPQIRPVETTWGEVKDQVTYMTVDGMTKKWIRTHTYGGKLAENVTQAICRDIMAEAMLRVEAAGYPIVLTVHDELVSEVPEGFGSVEEFCALMSVVPSWAVGFPIKAAGWRGKRYKK